MKGQLETVPEGTRWDPGAAMGWAAPRGASGGWLPPLWAPFWLRTCFCLEIILVDFQRIPRNFTKQLF